MRVCVCVRVRYPRSNYGIISLFNQFLLHLNICMAIYFDRSILFVYSEHYFMNFKSSGVRDNGSKKKYSPKSIT